MNMTNNNQLNTTLPLLLKRHHFIKEFGLSDSLYYSLLKNNKLPVIEVNGRKYIHRDKFFEMFNQLTEGDINQ